MCAIQVQTHKKTTLIMPHRFWAELKSEAANADVTMNDLLMLAVRILLAIINEGIVTEDLAQILAKRDPDALEALKRVMGR